MSEVAEAAVVRKTLEVETGIERAFRVFTERMGEWWPKTHHIGKADFVAIVMEPRAGGRMFERSESGAECEWGTVLAWDPPRRVVFSWHLQPDWSFDADMARASEVEIRFTAEGEWRTRVELEHRNLERHGKDWRDLRTGLDSAGGWTQVLEGFVVLVAEAE
jgi:uncharacterized protein YndB with AHSA1/START domain